MRYTQPQNGPSTLSDLAKSLGFTHAWNFGEGSTTPANAVTGAQAIALANNASSVVGVGGRAVKFSGTSSDRLEITGNPFATSTCTYLWVESGIDATAGAGQSLTESKYGTLAGVENGSLQIRLTNGNIQIVQAQIAVTLTGTGARDNTGKLNVCALSVAGNNGRHAIFTGGNLITSASPATSYTHGTSAIGGGSDCPSSTIKTYALFFAPKVIPDLVLQDLTRNFWQLFRSPQRGAAAAAVGIALSADATTRSFANSGLTTQITLAASAVSPSSASASLTVGAAALSSTAVTPSSASAGLTTQVALITDGKTATIASSALTTQVALSAAVTSAVNASAILSTQIPLTADARSPASASASLTVGAVWAASAATGTVAAASLTTAVSLGSSAQAPSSGNAALSTAIALSAAAVSKASADAAITTQVALAAVASAAASSAAQLATGIALSASSASPVSATTALTAPGSGFSADARAASFATASLSTQIALATAAASSSSAIAALAPVAPRQYPLAGQHQTYPLEGKT